jgi:3-deoxy-D-manno-octulosonic-acid transferase
MMWRAAYAAVLWLLLPWLFVRLWWRGRKEPLYRSQIGERFGRYRFAGSAGRPVIWVHAVSLGETRAAQPLLERLLRDYPDHHFVLTQMTATGREAAESLFGSRVTLAWLPYDYSFAVRAFLRRFRPAIGILMETEVWFTLVRECRRAGVPMLLANARLSEKSARGYAAVGSLAHEAFASLSAVAAQTDDDAARLKALGASAVTITGNLKFDMADAGDAATLAERFRTGYGNRRVFLAASTREGEEELLLEALAERPLDALTVIVPRHPQRFDQVAALLKGRGVPFTRRSESLPVPPEHRFVLGDSIGEMGAYFSASDVAFVGGSLLAYGGQNLIEGCAAGVPVLVGPYTYNFAQAADQAIAEGAAWRVDDAGALIERVAVLLEDAPLRRAMGDAGRRFCARHRGATARLAKLVDELLTSPAPR